MMADLIEHLFAPHFPGDILGERGDSAVIGLPGSDGRRLAFTTDSFVINPLFFPGGSIGELAVNGTVNDLAMSGAQPLYLSAGFILEEGLTMEDLAVIVGAMGKACQEAGVVLAAGDTKVVEKGHGDGLFINTAGLGLIEPGVQVGPSQARPGDVILVNGPIADHGIAVMSVRHGLEFESEIVSDTAPLHGIVAALLAAAPDAHCLRDATRGGLAAALNELAQASQVGIDIDERTIPVRPAVQAACEMLGLDPLYVANEGKFVAFVPHDQAEAALAALQAHPLGEQAAVIGEVVASHPRLVAARTGIGGSRIVDLPAGELLPRIC